MPRIQHKRGTSANLASVNPTPLAGELVFVSDENAIKIGDGSTAWTSLAYVTATPRSHNHDDRYYTETEVDNLLAGKAASSHTHTFSQISDITFPFPLADNSIVVYTAGVGWGVASAIGTIGVGSQPLGGWPAGSVGASLAGKVDTSDSRLTDARLPTAHKASHATGGSDALTPADIGAAPAASPAITGNATFEASSGVPVTITNTGTGNSFVVNDAAGDTTPFLIDASGNTGIGANPSSFSASFNQLVVGDGGAFRGATIYSTTQGTLAFGDTAVTTAAGFQGFVAYIHTDDRMIFGTAGAERVRITSAGDVGIGRTAPASRLDVNGVITVSATSGSAGSYQPSVTFSGDANTGFGQVSGQSDTASIFTAGHERVRVDASGRVGIGATPGTTLHVASATGRATPTPTEIRIATTSAGSDWSTTDSWGRIGFYSADTSGNGPATQAAIEATSYNAAGSTSRLQLKMWNGTAMANCAEVKHTGAVRFIPRASDPADPEAGDVYYNSSTNKLRVYDGTSWVDLH